MIKTIMDFWAIVEWPVIYTASTLAIGWLLWVFFLAVMMLRHIKETEGLPPETEKLGMSVLFVGLIIDFAWNLLMSIPLLELPREGTFTARATRHLHDDNWRGSICRWCCKKLLDPFQLGGHCK